MLAALQQNGSALQLAASMVQTLDRLRAFGLSLEQLLGAMREFKDPSTGDWAKRITRWVEQGSPRKDLGQPSQSPEGDLYG